MQPAQTDDATIEPLVIAARNGDIRAFDSLVIFFRPTVFAVCLAILRDTDEAEDTTQTALLSAFRNLRQLHSPARFGFWITTIARNACRGALRAQKQEVASLTDEMVLATSRTLSLRDWRAVHDSLHSEELSAEILTLEQDLALVAQLALIEGLDIASTAKTLGLTEATTKWRLHLARQALRQNNPSQS